MTMCKNCEKPIAFHPILKQWVHGERDKNGKVLLTLAGRSCGLKATPKT